MYPDTSYAEKSGGETFVGGSAPGKEYVLEIFFLLYSSFS